MTIESGILWQSVDEHEQVGRAADTSHFDGTGRSCAQSITEDATSSDEESRHLLAQRREHRWLIGCCELGTANNRDVERQMSDVGTIARTGDHHIAQTH